MIVWGRVGACPERSRRDPSRPSGARRRAPLHKTQENPNVGSAVPADSFAGDRYYSLGGNRPNLADFQEGRFQPLAIPPDAPSCGWSLHTLLRCFHKMAGSKFKVARSASFFSEDLELRRLLNEEKPKPSFARAGRVPSTSLRAGPDPSPHRL